MKSNHKISISHKQIDFLIKGIDLQKKAVERAVKLSANKYCSASIMLGKSVKITHDFVISEE